LKISGTRTNNAGAVSDASSRQAGDRRSPAARRREQAVRSRGLAARAQQDGALNMADLPRSILALPNEILFQISVMRELVNTMRSASPADVAAAVTRMGEEIEALSEKASRALGDMQGIASRAGDAQANRDEAQALRADFDTFGGHV
jgi:hypothetical protein